MKQMLRKKDVWVLLAALIGAFACVTLIQFISGRIDGVASMVFLLAVFFVSMYTDGYWWGVAGSVISVLAVNFAFRTPYFAFNFTIPENIFSGVVMLVVSFMTSTLTTRIKKQEQLRMESETEKMRANLLRATFSGVLYCSIIARAFSLLIVTPSASNFLSTDRKSVV